MPDDPTRSDDADSVHGHPVMATGQERRDLSVEAAGRQAVARPFAPPEPPPPGADRLTLDAYELERYAYEKELERQRQPAGHA